MERKFITEIDEETKKSKRIFPITHASAVYVDSETTLDDYLEGILSNSAHNHANKNILDNTTAVYNLEKDAILTKLANASNDITRTYNLIPNSWYGTKAPYTYALSIPELTFSSKVDILVYDNISQEEYSVLKDADIVLTDNSISDGMLILKAFGIKPTLEIPITLVISS